MATCHISSLRQVKQEFGKVHKSLAIDGNKHIWTIGQYSPEGPVPGTENLPFHIDPSMLAVSTSSRKGNFTITNHQPFIAWWTRCRMSNDPGTRVLVNYTGETKASEPDVVEFWAGFAVAVEQYNIRNNKRPQSLNKVCFDKYGWDKEKIPGTQAYYITVPHQDPPELTVEPR